MTVGTARQEYQIRKEWDWMTMKRPGRHGGPLVFKTLAVEVAVLILHKGW